MKKNKKEHRLVHRKHIDKFIKQTDQAIRIIEVSKEHLSKKSSFLKNRSIIFYLIPSKRREEVIGDLIETEMQMIENGIPAWKVKVVLCFHVMFIIISLFKMRLFDYGKKKTDVNK